MGLESSNKSIDRSHLRRSFESAIDELLAEGPKAYQRPREMLIDPASITSEVLEKMTQLKFEISLARFDDEIVLMTGVVDDTSMYPLDKKSMAYYRAMAERSIRMQKTPWKLHNHPGSSGHALSAPDINTSSEHFSDSEIELLATSKGLIFYKYRGDAVLSDGGILSSEKMKRDAQIRDGIIVADVPWSDGGKISVACDYMAGKIDWETSKKIITEGSKIL